MSAPPNRVRAYQNTAAVHGTAFEPTAFAGKVCLPHLFGAVTKHRLDRSTAKQLCEALRRLGADARCARHSAYDEDDLLLVLLAASAFAEGDTL